MFDGIYLEYPEVLSILILFAICAKFCKQKNSAIYFPHSLNSPKSELVSMKFLSLLKWLGLVLVVFALSSPVKDENITVKPTDGIDIALILDASQSMSARGFDRANTGADRFMVVKNIVKEFINERVNDNLGLVVFGQYSFIASPLTYDKKILDRIVSQLNIGMAGKYTALYESLAQGANLLSESKAKSKIAILLTDGHDSGTSKIDLDTAMALLKKNNIKVYVIGIGEAHEYNGALLNRIATESGGVAFGATSSRQLLQIYKKIDELEKSKIQRNEFTFKNYFYHLPLFFGLFFLLIYVFVRNKR
ncbi:MAG: VWA domain-containing protein [Helicobacteraceae bacterium]|nr:VWA domain-containing protein [Helicobacteraceae bacterium]